MAKRGMDIKTMSQDMERKLLHQDLAKERDSDEDGGAKTRVEFDSDFSLSEEEENAHLMEDPDADPYGKEKENWHGILTTKREKHNTGPKGVRADYEEAKQIVKRRQETKRLQDEEEFRRIAYGSKFTGASQSVQAQIDASLVKKYDADDEDNDDGDESSDDDEAFLQLYRQQRMQEMSGFSHLPQFGKVIYVEKFSFLDEVDNAAPETFVVTHIFEDYITACKKMNHVLDQFAAKHTHVKILKLKATEASQTLSHRVLPAFLVYRNQEMVKDSSIGVNEHAFGNPNFGLQEVEVFFSSQYGIPLSGVNITDKEKSEFAAASAGAERMAASEKSWTSSFQPTIKSVNLMGNRLQKMSLKEDGGDDDDDDW